MSPNAGGSEGIEKASAIAMEGFFWKGVGHAANAWIPSAAI
jgi:hypothetical protein